MQNAHSGLLGGVLAQRPYLMISVVAVGLTTLAAAGARFGVERAVPETLLRLVLNIVTIVVVPSILFGLRPRRGRGAKFGYGGALAVGLAVLIGFYEPIAALIGGVAPPRQALLLGAGLLGALYVLSPFYQYLYRLPATSISAIALGGAGAIGYFAYEPGVDSAFMAEALTLAIAGGAMMGAGTGFSFAEFFAEGASRSKAAAAAAHSALAPVFFAILVSAGYFGVSSFGDNFGAVAWDEVFAGLAVMAMACVSVLCVVIGILVKWNAGEQVAVDQNYQQRWFARVWSPLRKHAPHSTAIAATAIFSVVAIVTAFEVGVLAPMASTVLLVAFCAAALLTFVSVRSTLFIIYILTITNLYARYGLTLFGGNDISGDVQLFVYALQALALSQLTLSWRDSNDKWRTARDVAEAAMSGGTRRFLLAVLYSAASLMICALTFSWPQGAAIVMFYITGMGLALLVSPIVMIALSARTNRMNVHT